MFRKINSTQIHPGAVSFAVLVFRLAIGILMMPHGYNKMMHWDENSKDFTNFLGLGPSVSLALTIGAEFFCSLLLCLGLFTRLALIPLIIAMTVAVVDAHHLEIFGKGGSAFMYLMSYILLIIIGPGRYSADRLIFK
jgi:putative oxidoreductase